MIHDTTVAFVALGVAAQGLVAALLVIGAFALAGIRGPLAFVRSLIWGYELWLAWLVAAMSTGGSLFFSEIADYPPCELCWYQRICMFPLAVLVLLSAVRNDHRVARYFLLLPAVGAGLSVYHLLLENNVVGQSQACLASAPGGCATKWIDELGYVTIPTLTLTAFLLAFALLLLASFEEEAT